jgi:hypothetical protein
METKARSVERKPMTKPILKPVVKLVCRLMANHDAPPIIAEVKALAKMRKRYYGKDLEYDTSEKQIHTIRIQGC